MLNSSKFASLLALLLFLVSGSVFSQKESIATVSGTDKGVNLTLPAPYNQSVFAGTFTAVVDGNPTSLYCIDLSHSLVYNQAYQDVSSTDVYMTHILNNYYPFVAYPYTGALSTVEKEAAAVQVALWYFADGLNVSGITDTQIKNRALSIIADANANAHLVLPTDVLLVIPPSQNIPINTATTFMVAAYDINGAPLSGRTINLSATNATLSTTTATTAANGTTPAIIVTPNSGATSVVITAETHLTIPAGTKYYHVASPNTYQKLILAKPVYASKTVTSNITYYTPQSCNLMGYTTFTQGGWGSPNNSTPGTIRETYFSTVFPTGLTIGSGSNTATFTTSTAIKNFLPAGGTAGALTGSSLNPTSTTGGVLAGQVTALMLNVYYNASGALGTNSAPYGTLYIVSGPFAGMTVNQFLAIANQALGGVNTSYSFSDINAAATALNENFDNGTVNRDYVTCPPSTASLGDKVWIDSDRDGIQDPGEAGLPNIAVTLYNCSGTQIATTVTDANGNYSFTNLAPGSYYVNFFPPFWYLISPRDAGSDDTKDSDVNPANGNTDCITLSAGENNLTIDAGMYVNTASLGDYVWNDANHNGIQDPSETGIPNVTVNLYNCDGNFVATTTTNANGYYLFSNLPPTVLQLASQSYYVEFVAPSGYAFTTKDAGSDDNLDSDADVVTGKTDCIQLSPGENKTSVDAGLYSPGADLHIVKTVDDQTVSCGQNVTYTITITNNGPLGANSVTVSDALPAGLQFVNATASQGSYDQNTGVWTVGTLANGASAALNIAVQVDCGVLNNTVIDLGPASDYNVFVIGNMTQPSADTQGKLAVGGNLSLAGYSVGDQLTPNSSQDVLVVGGDLYFTSGGIYGGNVAYGGNSNLPTNAVTVFHGTVRHDANVIDFGAAKTYLENLSNTLGGYAVSGTTSMQWGSVNMEGSDPFLNVFSVNGADITAAHTVNITVPNGSVVLVNVQGTSVDWKGGLFVNGTAVGNVIYNFPQATYLRIYGIDIRGSILAPFADVNFVSGVQHGQMIAKSIVGQGQFNLSPFHGNIPSSSVINVAAITGSDQTDPVSTDNSSSVTISLALQSGGGSGGSGGGSGSGNWQLVGTLPATEIIMAIESDASNNIYAAAITGFIYKSTDGGMTWARTNNDMYSGPVWALKILPNGTIFAATVTGVYKSVNGSDWSLTNLQSKDVRSIEADNNGNLYAGTWSFGVFKSTDLGTTWTASNTGMAPNSVITSMTLTPNQDIYTGTFGNGVSKSTDLAANWSQISSSQNYIWAMASNSNGHIFAGTYGEGIYRSTDNGATWVKTTFPALHIYSLIIDAGNNIYASSYASGIYVSSDNGDTWTSLGLAGQNVSSLMINPNSSGVYAATKSGQVYKMIDNPTSTKEDKIIPTELKLAQNYPNPFNPSTRIEVAIPKSGNFRLVIYSMLGEVVQTLIDGQLEAGIHSVNFNGTDLTSGIYIYKLTGENVNISKKMMLVK